MKAMESTSKRSFMHLKKVLLNSKCSWSDDVSSKASSSEAPDQKQDHRKLKFIRRCET